MPTWPAPIARRRWWALAGCVGGLALLSSLNGIGNDFTYDDLFIIVGNPLVHDLRRWWAFFFVPYWPIRLGGDGYRPLTLLAFALQWAISPQSPLLFHAVTIALYALTAVSVFWLASLLLPAMYAWLAAALFAVHPVHVEAVASIVGQSEVWAGLLLVSATAMYIQWRRAGKFGWARAVIVCFVYLAACLFKEHAAVLPVALIAAEVLVVAGPEQPAARLRLLRPFYLGLLLVGCFFVVFRGLVINNGLGGFTPFIPFVSLHVGPVDRALTMLGVVPLWARLLLWPTVLTSEYGPPANPIAHGFALWQLFGIAVMLALVALVITTRRRAPVIAFGIVWMALMVLPSSNFIIPSGVLCAERTLFTPSVGAMLAVGAALPFLLAWLHSPVSRILFLVGAGCLLLGGTVKSVVQTAVWRNNDVLFRHAVRTSPMVYRSHYILGAWMMANRQYGTGEQEYLKAISLFPSDPFVAYNLGQEYFHAGLFDRAYEMYSRAEQIMPRFQDAQAQMALARAMQGRYSDAARLAGDAIRNGVGDLRTLHAILTAGSLDTEARRKLASRLAQRPASVIIR